MAWRGGYAGSEFENSAPPAGDLPLILLDSTVGPAGSPVDMHLENFTTDPFAYGTLVSILIQAPVDRRPLPDEIALRIVPGVFSGDAGDIPASAPDAFTLRVVPEPSSAILLLAASLCLRKRSRGPRPGTSRA